MNSRIYHCNVMHTRLKPVKHSFVYPVYVLAIELSELMQLDKELPLFGYNRFRPLSIFDKDYLSSGEKSIVSKLKKILIKHNLNEEITRIVLVTSARYFNYVFNPVSFYYCYRNDGALACVAAEVNNTFHEKHLYLLTQPKGGDESYTDYEVNKEFFVSPFNDMRGGYDFRFSELSDSLDIRLDLVKDGATELKSRIWGKSVPLNTYNLLQTIVRTPLLPWLTMPRILWQAAKLYYGRKLTVRTKPNPNHAMTLRRAPAPLVANFYVSIVKRILLNIQHGCLQLTMPDHSVEHFGDIHAKQKINLNVNHYDFFRRVVFGGSTGFGESYVAGDWDTEDLTQLLVFFLNNQSSLNQFIVKTAWLSRAANKVCHAWSNNSIRRSRQNIQAHYDLSNDFFQLFLDDSMTYSCAYYKNESDDLAQAQLNKINLIIQKAQICEDDHVLEIGSGWGSFAIQAVKQTGCKVTTVTLSEEQQKLARERVEREGLSDRIHVQLCDYRKLEGQFDKIVSIEMIEAVGHEYLGAYFSQIDHLLKKGGVAVIQAIAVIDQNYETYRKESDWIQKYIFPGGMAPSLQVITEKIMKHTRFFIDDVENFGMDYARTLWEWKKGFHANRNAVLEMGFDQNIVRKWEYYFSYCEAGFLCKILNTYQIVLKRPEID